MLARAELGLWRGTWGRQDEPHLIHMKRVSHGIERLLYQKKGQGVRGYQTNEHLCSVYFIFLDSALQNVYFIGPFLWPASLNLFLASELYV